MKAHNFEILIPSLNQEKMFQLENAVLLASNIFKKKKGDFKFLYSSDDEQLTLKLEGEIVKVKQIEIEEMINSSLEKKMPRLLFAPFELAQKKYTKPKISQEHNLLLDSTIPLLTFNNILFEGNFKSIIAPIALNEDFMPIVMKLLKFVKNFKGITLHIVSVMYNSNDYTLNKATQQLSFLNHLFSENEIKYTAEIISTQIENKIKTEIVLDHISRVNADLVVLFKNIENFSVNNEKENIFELISKSIVPVITFA